MQRTWALADEPGLHLCIWDEDSCGIGFDERSGDTFVLSPLALELMAELRTSGAQTAESLTTRLSHELGPSSQPLAVAVVMCELESLSTRGLLSTLPT